MNNQVTWAVNVKSQTAVVFCNNCRAVLSDPVPIWQSQQTKDEHAGHVCNPPA